MRVTAVAPSFPARMHAQVSFEERAKCEEETLSNVDGKLKTSSKQKASGEVLLGASGVASGH